MRARARSKHAAVAASFHRRGAAVAASHRDIRLNDVRIEDGTVRIIYDEHGTERRIEKINANLSLPHLIDPLTAKGEFDWKDKRVGFDLKLTSPADLAIARGKARACARYRGDRREVRRQYRDQAGFLRRRRARRQVAFDALAARLDAQGAADRDRASATASCRAISPGSLARSPSPRRASRWPMPAAKVRPSSR